jgi:hypothetical protein
MVKQQDAKRIGLIVATILAAVLFWGTAEPWLANALRFEDWRAALWPSLALVLLTAVAGISLMLLQSRWDRSAAILASWASFLLFYEPNLWYASVLPVFFWFWYEASRRMRDDLSDRRRIRVNATLGRALKLVLLGAFLMVSMAFYLQILEEDSGQKTVQRVIAGGVSLVYDNATVARELEKLPDIVRGTVKQAVTARVEGWVQQQLGGYAFLAPPVLAFTLFFTLWALSFIFREFAIWLGVVIFGVLRRTGFVTVERSQVTAETLAL